MSKFSVGERWFCDRSVGGNPYNRPTFTFVITGVGTRAGYKICRIESECRTPASGHGSEEEYSHKHLKKYAVHIPKEAA